MEALLFERSAAAFVTGMVVSIASAGLGDVPVIKLPPGGKAVVQEAYDASLLVVGPDSELAGPHAAPDPEPSLGRLVLRESNRGGVQLSRTRVRSIGAPIATPADRELAAAIATGADDEPVTAARSRSWHGAEDADGVSGMEAALLTRFRAGRDNLFTGERRRLVRAAWASSPSGRGSRGPLTPGRPLPRRALSSMAWDQLALDGSRPHRHGRSFASSLVLKAVAAHGLPASPTMGDQSPFGAAKAVRLQR